MKSLLATLVLTTALTLPGLAMARPVTLTTTMNSYGGDGAYLALYVTDASGAYVGSLWMAGGKSKYYEHLSDWYAATGGEAAQINASAEGGAHWTYSEQAHWEGQCPVGTAQSPVALTKS